MTSGSWRSLAAVALWAISTGASAASWVVEGRVVGVSDGDTITDPRPRQASAQDPPVRNRRAGEGPGVRQRSKESLSRLVFDKSVEAHCHKKDRYGREVCKVMRGATDVNLEQLRAGMAWWYREYAKEQSRGRSRELRCEEEGDARRADRAVEGC